MRKKEKKTAGGWMFLFCLWCCLSVYCQSDRTTVYFFPGQGSDDRIFEKIELDSTRYQSVFFAYPTPEKRSDLRSYAHQFIDSIDTSSPFVLIGVSLGGMMCVEISDTLKPKKTIIISSAKSRSELPFRYRFQRYLPLYKIFPKRMLLGGAKMMQPIVEPDRNKNKSTFQAMLNAKDPMYMKRTIGLIVRWRRIQQNHKIDHIHGTKDNTLPYRKVDANYTVQGGSHMMTLTEGERIFEIILELLEEDESVPFN